ncbi:MAG: acyltransferase family protein [Deltaproteobacteria bacterium]|nr:acyltransferase family protein [Deltaproteobacteria bacterium]
MTTTLARRHRVTPFDDLLVDPEIARAFDQLPETVSLNSLGYDRWGFHPQAARVYFSLAHRIYKYFRPNIVGIDNIPEGRVLIVPNHSGQLPIDGLIVAVACLLELHPPRMVRAMAERWFPTLPWVNIAFSRSGVVVGDPINCKNLLEADNAILVFPEGARGSGKIFQKRYQLQDFGRGFMRLALQTNTPIVPVGVVGGEESIISIANFKPLAKALGFPYVPVPALLPLLGPLAFLPLPVRFHVRFGKPIRFEGKFDDEDDVIQEKVNVVTDAVDALTKEGRAERKSWFK